MRALKLAILVIATLCIVDSDAARRRRRKRPMNAISGFSSNSKAKISMAACAARCNRKGGCKKGFSVAKGFVF